MFASQDGDPSPIRVAVVHNSQIHSQLLADGMARDPQLRAFSACTPADFLQAAAHDLVDVGVISSGLDEEPGRGFEVLRTLRSSYPHIRAVMLLESSKREMVVEAFRAGARGVIGKQASLADLCKCIRCVHSGQVWANAKEMLYALDVLATLPSISAVDHRGVSLLTEREIEVVACLGEGLTNREIGERLGLSRHTVKNYLFRIFDKIGVSSRIELLHLALRQPTTVRESLRQQDKDNSSESERCRKAAENGSPEAQMELAEQYCNKLGTSRDHVSAFMWYLLSERSIANLRQRANSAKAKLAHLMTAEEIREAQARASEWLKEPQERSSTFPARGVVVERESTKFSVA